MNITWKNIEYGMMVVTAVAAIMFAFAITIGVVQANEDLLAEVHVQQMASRNQKVRADHNVQLHKHGAVAYFR